MKTLELSAAEAKVFKKGSGLYAAAVVHRLVRKARQLADQTQAPVVLTYRTETLRVVRPTKEKP